MAQMSYYNLNHSLKSGASNIYNLGIDILNGIEIYILPLTLSTSVNGFNEVQNNKMWLLEPKGDSSHKISISVDGVIIPIKSGLHGESATNPIVFRRIASPKPLNVLINGAINTIYPFYGSDSTPYTTDWMRSINNCTYDLNVITSLPSSGNVMIDQQYFANHLVNTNESDSIIFNVLINDGGDSSLATVIQQQLYECTFVVQNTIYNKSITTGFDLLYNKNYEIYSDSEIGIRF